MRDRIEQYIKIRNYVLLSVTEKLQVFMTDIWDPLIKYVIIREINDMVKKAKAVAQAVDEGRAALSEQAEAKGVYF